MDITKTKIDERLVSYIQQELKKGFSEEEIKNSLSKAGHDPVNIGNHFNHVQKQKSKSKLNKLIIALILFFLFATISYFAYSNAKFDTTKKIESHIAKGNLLCSKGEYQKANEEFDKAINLNQTKSRAYYYKGKCYASVGKYGEAIIPLNKAVQLYRRSAYYYYYLGLSYCGIGNYENGIANLNRAISLNNSNQKFYKTLDGCDIKREGTEASSTSINPN